MTLEDGINIYVQRKHAAGMSFEGGNKIFRSFLRAVGNVPLSQLNFHHVLQFLNRHQSSATTFRIKHSLLRRFFDYWAAHGLMARLPMPANRPAQASRFLPYIYTREEIRRLLRMASKSKTTNDKIHHRTLRAALLVLYATGATVSEVTKLRIEDVDLRHGSIQFSGSVLRARRCIPIGRDLLKAVRQYVDWRKRVGRQSVFLFSRVDGREIDARALRSYFERFRRMAGIAGYRESSQWPCIRDLRATFAVHQITSWLKSKKDSNRMLPALGVYMGNIGLESAERYLQLTPQRFQSALNKLSPPKSRARWRDDSVLLEFLVNL